MKMMDVKIDQIFSSFYNKIYVICGSYVTSEHIEAICSLVLHRDLLFRCVMLVGLFLDPTEVEL